MVSQTAIQRTLAWLSTSEEKKKKIKIHIICLQSDALCRQANRFSSFRGEACRATFVNFASHV